MRISDWSQTCALPICSLSKQRANFDGGFGALYGVDRPTVPAYEVIDLRAGLDFGRYSVELFAKNLGNSQDRKSVVSGKSVSVRVDTGGRRIIKKKRQTNRFVTVSKICIKN